MVRAVDSIAPLPYQLPGTTVQPYKRYSQSPTQISAISSLAYPTVPYTDRAQSLRRGDETHHLSVTVSHVLRCRPSHYGIIFILPYY